MSVVNVVKNTYTVDPLYQWDLNQLLEIHGLSLPTIPEIHFSNAAMERAIVRQATMDAAGVVYVEIPNSLLQKPHTINAYVCLYSGETFESLYKFDIPVKARKQPSDYVITDSDDEIYSFNALENLVNNVLTNTNAVLANDKVIIEQAKTAIKNTETAVAAANKAVADVETVKDGVTSAASAAAAAQKSADDAASAAANKTDKVSEATADNFAALTANGNLKDSGLTPEKLRKIATRTVVFTHDDVFIVPDGVTSLRVMCYGGGGSGGYGTEDYPGGGGGGGYYTEETIAVTPGEKIPVTIGLGGIVGTVNYGETSTTMHNGGTTSFGTYLSADGGEHGGQGNSVGYSHGGGGGSGGGGAYSNYGGAVGSGGRGYQFGGGGAGRCHPDYTQTPAPGGSMGGAGGTLGSAGSDGIDTSNMDVPFPGVAPGGAANSTGSSYPGAGGGGGYGAPGGCGNGYAGGGGGGYGGAGGDSLDTTDKKGGSGGGGYGPSGKGGSSWSPYSTYKSTRTKRPQDGGIGAGGAGASGDTSYSAGWGGDGICVVTYTLPI